MTASDRVEMAARVARAAWLEMWDESDPRRAVLDKYKVIVRQPCVAQMLVETHEDDAPTGWRNNWAFEIARSLRQDMSDEQMSAVVERWNQSLPAPLDIGELESVVASASSCESRAAGCDGAKEAFCVGEDDCDFVRRYFNRALRISCGVDALMLHGMDERMKANHALVYEAVCRLEMLNGVPDAGAVFASHRDISGITRGSTTNVGDYIRVLEECGYLNILDPGDAHKRKALKVQRVMPVPLHANDGVVLETGLSPAGEPWDTPVWTRDPERRSEFLEEFLDRFCVVPDGAYIEYLHGRGFTDSTIQQAGFRVFPKHNYGKAINWCDGLLPRTLHQAGLYKDFFRPFYMTFNLLLPYRMNGLTLTLKGRRVDSAGEDKYRNMRGEMPKWFASFSFDPAHPLVLCEGEFDALSVAQLGFSAVAVPGATYDVDEVLRQIEPTSVVLALDPDDAGGKLRFHAIDYLKKHDVPHVSLNFGTHEDVNEWLSSDPDGLTESLKECVAAVSRG